MHLMLPVFCIYTIYGIMHYSGWNTVVYKISKIVINKKYVLSTRTRSLSNATFSVLIMWRSSSSKSAAVYKISWKSDNFSPRYGDITIFKMAAVRHLEIVLPPYETTHEVSVAGLRCLPNFMSIWYTDLKIYLNLFGLKCLLRPPKWGFWETLDP